MTALPPPGDARETAARIESLAARLLTWGTRAALALIAAGVAGMLATGTDPIAAPSPEFSPRGTLGDLLALRPSGFLWAGLVALIALPVGRVVVSGAGFMAAGDRRLALVSALVAAVIGASVLAALALEG